MDDLKRLDVFQYSTTIKRLSLRRRPRAAVSDVEKTHGAISHTQWQSAESLSSLDARLLGMPSSVTAGRPPRPPPLSSSSDSKVCRNEGPAEPVVSKEPKPQPAARSLSKKTTPETQKQADQGVSNQAAPQPRPRRRLASFGGVSSPGSASPFTGLGAYNQDSGRPPEVGNETHAKLSSSLGSRGSTGCLRLNPESSGRTTPVPNLGPTHLQLVRDQMVVALQKLKELEEQVKIIPILQVKISVLQEEKRQLASQLRTQSDSEELSRERTATAARLQPSSPKSLCTKLVHTDRVEVRSVATEVSEIHLGIYTEREAEIDAQQLIIGALKDRISHLEAELKESALQAEMSRLKLELKAAGARTRADKSSLARPSTAGASTEARPPTANQGVGSPTELCDASSVVEIEVKTVGTCCRPELKDVCAGPDVPMSRWDVRERVEVAEKSAGDHVFMSTQGVGTETKSCDAETNTEMSVEDLAKKDKMYNSVACGDCSVHVVVSEERTSVQTVSRYTNTVASSVSSSTNTVHTFIKDSSTNTVLNTRNKHSNTAQAITRTVSVGNLAKDVHGTPESCRGCASASSQIQTQVSKVTRDAGVGFIDINDNFLVGLKIRHMASGPSHLPDPNRTRSIGVGEGRVRNLTASCSHPVDKLQSQWDPELNHYIEKMHKLLKGQGDLIQEDWSLPREGTVLQQQENSIHKLSKDNTSTLIHPLDIQPPGNSLKNRLFLINVFTFVSSTTPGLFVLYFIWRFITNATTVFFFFSVRKCHSPPQHSPDSFECDLNPEMLVGRDTDVKRMIQKLEEQTASVLQGECVTCLWVHLHEPRTGLRNDETVFVRRLCHYLCAQTTPNTKKL